MNDLSTIIGLTIALGTLTFSLIYWWRISPKVFFRVAGEQLGEPIPTSNRESIFFAIGTSSPNQVNILSLAVYFDDNQVDLFKTKGIEKEMSTERQLPMAIIFPEQKVVTKNRLQTNYFDFQAKADNFTIKLVATVEPDHSRLPFWFSILPVRKVHKERIVQFRIDADPAPSLQKQGLMLKPGESFQIAGPQSQEGISAAASQGTVTVDVREILDE